MIKKFVSKALLSMVMDKSARDALEARREGPPPDGAPSRPKPGAPTEAPLDAATNAADDLAQTIELALADARAEADEGAARPRRGRAPGATPAEPSTPERERLIQDALAIHRQKTRMLDSLDPVMREKLSVMAMMALDPDSLPNGGKRKAEAKDDGRVDDIGGAKKRPIKRR